MAINVQRIALTHEKLRFLHYPVPGVIHALIDVLGHFFSHFATMKFEKLNLSIFLGLLRKREKSQQYFDPLAFN